MLVVNLHYFYKKWEAIEKTLNKIIKKKIIPYFTPYYEQSNINMIVDINLIGTKEMIELNKIYRDKIGNTDIISVCNRICLAKHVFLGECFLSYTYVKNQNPMYYFTENWIEHHNLTTHIKNNIKIQHKELVNKLRIYNKQLDYADSILLANALVRVIHGLLHIFAYNHITQSDFTVMRSIEKKIIYAIIYDNIA